MAWNSARGTPLRRPDRVAEVRALEMQRIRFKNTHAVEISLFG